MKSREFSFEYVGGGESRGEGELAAERAGKGVGNIRHKAIALTTNHRIARHIVGDSYVDLAPEVVCRPLTPHRKEECKQ